MGSLVEVGMHGAKHQCDSVGAKGKTLFGGQQEVGMVVLVEERTPAVFLVRLKGPYHKILIRKGGNSVVSGLCPSHVHSVL